MATSYRAVPSVGGPQAGEEEVPVPARGGYGWLPAGVAVAAIVGLLCWVDTSLWDVLRYGGYLAWGVVLPGTLLYRAARRTPHSLVDDLAMGAALGLALEIAAYTVFAAAGVARWLVLWPLAVVVPFLAAPGLRRHWRPRLAPVPPAWSWTVAGVVVCFAGYTAVAALAGYPPVPNGAGSWYVLDQHYLLSITAELKHHFPPQLPQLSGEALHYHWFAYAHEAVASLVSGVDTPAVAFRLAPMTLSVGAALLLATVGWRVSGNPWVGALAAALTFAVGETVLGTLSPYLGSAATFVWTGHSALYGWLATFALVSVVADRLRPTGLPDAPLGPGAWPLMAAFALLAAGGKSSVLPVVLAGVGLAGLAGLLAHQRQPRLWGSAALLLGAFAFGTVVLYRFESGGLALDPLRTIRSALPSLYGASLTREVGLLGIGLAGYLVYQCARLAGIAVLARLARRRDAAWGPVEWFLLGATVAAVGGTLLLGHPSTAQLNFVRTGFGLGAILSAMGFVALVRRCGASARAVVLTVASCVVVTVAVVRLLAAYPAILTRFPRAADMGPTTTVVVLCAALAAAGAVATLAWFLTRRAIPRLRGLGPLVALTAVLFSGAYGLVDDAQWSRGFLVQTHPWHGLVTGDQAASARWLRANSSADDLLATNRHFVHPANQQPLSFALEAYAERRLLLGSWGYGAEAASLSRDLGVNPSSLPFWDPALLAANDAAFSRPDPANIETLRGYGVRWLVADRDAGPVSADLGRYAVLRYESGPVGVYELR